MKNLNFRNTARQLILISHTTFSDQVIQKGIGEIGNTKKLKTLLDQHGLMTSEVQDIYKLFGGKSSKRNIDKIAKVNLHLGWLGQPPVDDLNIPFAANAFRRVDKLIRSSPIESVLMVLTWEENMAAIVATGIQRSAPLIVKAQTPSLGSKICTPLYGASDFVVTENLFVNLFGAICGLPPWKMLYLPHHYPQEADALFALSENKVAQMRTDYVKRIAHSMGKPLTLTPNTVVAGIVSRFTEGKHIEHAIETFEKCMRKEKDAILILKGGYDDVFRGSAKFKNRLKKALERVSAQPWFYWDRDFTPFPEVLGIYRLFDLCLHFSGVEGASNSVVEMMSVGCPCLLLKENTNPYLFNGAAAWINPVKEINYGKRLCRIPDLDHAYLQVEKLLSNREEREEMRRKSRAVAVQRFAPHHTLEKIALMTETTCRYRCKESNAAECQVEVIQQLRQDLELYQIPLNTTLDRLALAQLPQLEDNLELMNYLQTQTVSMWV